MRHIKQLAYSLLIISSIILISCTDVLIGDEGKLREDIHLNYQSITDLELPFDEEWYVVWGGRSYIENNHHYNRNGRYAIDILQLVNGATFTGDGSKNEDYYCFGKRLNTPGDGKVIAIENNIEDNIPGNLANNSNYIIIDHLNGETSVLAHLKKGSIIVAVGDKVSKGQEIGKVGNSGNSTQPHLHYHLQTTSEDINEGIALPLQFTNYYENGQLMERGEPVRGQKVRKD